MHLCFSISASQVSKLHGGYISSCVAVNKTAHVRIIWDLIFVLLYFICIGYDDSVLRSGITATFLQQSPTMQKAQIVR